MLTEECVACGTDVPLSGAVHMLVNPKQSDEDVVDGYLCRGCYEEHVEPILPTGADEDDETAVDTAAGAAESEGDGDASTAGDGGSGDADDGGPADGDGAGDDSDVGDGEDRPAREA